MSLPGDSQNNSSFYNPQNGSFGGPQSGGFGGPQNGSFGGPQSGGFGGPQNGGFGGYGGVPTYTLTIHRNKQYTGSFVKYKIYLDGQQVAILKNGQTAQVQVTAGVHRIRVNKYSETTIEINGDTEAEAALIGYNNVGIINATGQSQATEQANEAIQGQSSSKKATGLLVTAIVFPIISVIIFAVTHGQYHLNWYLFVAGIVLAVINLSAEKKRRNVTDPKTYKSIHTKSVAALVLFLVFGLISLLMSLGLFTLTLSNGSETITNAAAEEAEAPEKEMPEATEKTESIPEPIAKEAQEDASESAEESAASSAEISKELPEVVPEETPSEEAAVPAEEQQLTTAGYTLDVPEGWYIEDGDAYANENGDAGIQVTSITKDELQGVSFSDIAADPQGIGDSVLSDIQSQYPDTTIQSAGVIMISGQQAIELVYAVNDSDYTMQIVYYYLENPGTGDIAIFTFLEDNAYSDQYGDVMNAARESITLQQ